VPIGSELVDLPIRYWRDDGFMGVFGADHSAVSEALPSDRLRPVRLPGGRTAVGVFAFNYFETGVGPYGEVGVAVPCTLDREAPPLLGLFAESAIPGFGAFVLHLPVTTRVARDGGRVIWGFPKFVADMDFEVSPAFRSVAVSEGGVPLLTLTVAQKGAAIRDNRPLVSYTALDTQLVRTELPTRAVYQLGGGGGATLELGSHPIAEELRALGIDGTAIAARNYLSHAAVLPRGEVVGTLERRHDGYAGSDLEAGRHTIRYDSGYVHQVTAAISSKREAQLL
jgi:hypothetical protein